MADSETEEEPGVMGNLPSTRPGVRSPRRDREQAKAATAPKRAAKTAAPAAPPSPPNHGRVGSSPPGADEIEALAKAGISVAAGAASLGFKLAGRAAGALRGVAPDRSDRDS